MILPDVRLAWRRLRAEPAFALAAILSLALGIGANTAVYSAVHALLVRPLPFPAADRLVRVSSTRGGEHGPLAVPEQDDLKLLTGIFEDVALYTDQGMYNASGFGEPEELPATIATHNLYSVLGRQPAVGAVYPADTDRTRQFRLLISHGLWERRFNRDPNIVGRTMTLDGAPGYVIDGVMPADFNFPANSDLFRSSGISANPETYGRRDLRQRMGLARLRPGVTIDQARAAVNALASRLAAEHPATNDGLGFAVTSLRDLYVSNVRAYLLLLFAAVALVLLTACVNVTNLSLSRALARQRDVVVRTALGASRWALARQSLIEGGLLAAAGAAAGLLIAWIATRGLEQSVRLELPPWMSFAIDPPVLLYLVAVTAAVGIFISLLPALRGSDADLGHVLRESGRGSAGSPRQERLRRSLVVAEVALAVALVATATFLVRSFQRLQDVNLGFHTADTLAFRVELGWRAYDSHDKAMQFSDRLLAGLGALPGVSAVASDSNLPLSGRPREPIELRLEGQAVSDRRNNPFVHLHVVSPAYFDTMGISIIRGRAFTAADRVDGEHVAVVGRRLADRLWPGRDPIGQRLMVGPEVPDGRWISVVGVAADIRHERVADSVLDVYRPYHQSWAGGSWFVLRTAGVEPASLARAATAIVGSIDPNQSFFDVRSMDDRRDAAVWQERLAGVLVALFGALAALLALVGLAGLVSFLVAQRRREIGVRLALGASPRGIVWAFVRGSGQLIGLGLLAGAGLAWLGSSLIRPLIFSPSGSDPIAFAVATLGLVAAAIAASWLTARRAALVDPVEVLRGE